MKRSPDPFDHPSESRGDPAMQALARMRAMYAVPPALDVEDRHIAAMMQAPRPLADAAPVVVHRIRDSRVLRASLAVVTMVLGASGAMTVLAVGRVVTLPAPARAVLRTFGIHLDAGHPDPANSVSPSARPTVIPSNTMHPQPSHSPGSDNADGRAHGKGDNADARAHQGGDNADQGHTASNSKGDNADPRATPSGDNADPRATKPPGDTAP